MKPPTAEARLRPEASWSGAIGNALEPIKTPKPYYRRLAGGLLREQD